MKTVIKNWWLGGVASYSADAQAVFALMSSLTPTQKEAMAAFIDGCVSDGNWTLLDVFQFYGLGATDGLKNWKSASFIATNPSGYSFATGGIDIPGTGNGVLTNYNPTNAAATNWAARNALEMVYVYTNDETTDQDILVGGTGVIYTYQRTVASRIDFLSVNGSARQVTGYGSGFVRGLWTARLVESGLSDTLQVYVDGVDKGTGAGTVTVERNDTARVGGRSDSATSTFNGIVTLYGAGAGDGFDVPAFSTRLDTMIAALGL